MTLYAKLDIYFVQDSIVTVPLYKQARCAIITFFDAKGI